MIAIDDLNDSFEVVDAVDEARRVGDMDRMLELLDKIVSLLDETDDHIDVNVLTIGAYRVSNACGVWHPTVQLLKNLCDSQEESGEDQDIKEPTRVIYAFALAHTGDVSEAEQILQSIVQTSKSKGIVKMAADFLECVETWREELTAPD